MSDKLENRLSELEDEIESHPYQEINFKLDELRVVLDTLEQNFDLLSEFIDEWLQDRATGAPLSERMKIRRELFRRLHNYLASYYTQYEFTKNLRDQTIGKNNENYNQLMREHNIRPTSDFLKALRNYIQKHTFLNVTTSFSVHGNEGVTEVRTYLSADEIRELKSSYRNQKAMEFIDNYGDDEIIITDVIESHHGDLMAFHDDFRKLIWDEYSEVRSAFNTLQEERTEIAQKLYNN